MAKMKFESPDMTAQNIDRIAALFPNCVTEALDEEHSTPEKKVYKRAINFELLKQMLSPDVVDGDERYEFTWVGKKAAIVEANKPIRKTLRPCKEESKNWDTTENLYIEGDNLEVLKLLQESYLGKVKMIYIDPPYNTGNDFIYADDFRMSGEEWSVESGELSEDGDRLFKNTDTNGRFHSDWCSMIYSRLMLARNLLTEDGVIFISIDDAEVENLRKICDEVLGACNFVACLVYDKNRKNDAKYFSVGHEYMLVYFKSMQTIYEKGIILREPKEGIDEVKAEFNRLRSLYNDDWGAVNDGLKKLYASWPKDDERKPLARFTKVDEFGPYRDDGNISWPGGGGPKYEVIHPITGKPCKCPDAGWRFPNLKRMQEEIDAGRVVFGPDETTLPRIRRNLFDYDAQVMRSVHFSYAQTATLEFNKIFDGKRIFENPKSITDIKDLIRYVTGDTPDCIILDFFSGSATTAHAVMAQNFADVYNGILGKRKFIMVQLPEPCDEKSEAYKAGYKNICEIGKERIRRVGKKLTENTNGQLSLEEKQPLDIGFKVLKLDTSNLAQWDSTPTEEQGALFARLHEIENSVKSDRMDLDVVYEVMLKLGVPLDFPVQEIQINDKKAYSIGENCLVLVSSPA